MTDSPAIISEIEPPTVYYFGKAITRKFIVTINQEDQTLPTQTPQIYLFAAEPTRAAAAAGTGAMQAITAWTAGLVSPFPYSYTFTAIADPSSDSTANTYQYWEAINFILEGSGSVQTVIRAFAVTRATGQYDEIGTKAEDLIKIYPAASDYFPSDKMIDHITLAIERFQIELISKGWRWADVGELRFAKQAIAYRALSTLCFSAMGEEGDRFQTRHELYAKEYDELVKLIPLRADRDRDGAAESSPRIENSILVSRR
jgi:hypothetical protein